MTGLVDRVSLRKGSFATVKRKMRRREGEGVNEPLWLQQAIKVIRNSKCGVWLKVNVSVGECGCDGG